MQSERSGLEVPLRGFGGEFRLQQGSEGKTAFIAGGIGITPLLAQLKDVDISRLQLFWSLHVKDIGLVYDTFERNPGLPVSSILYLSGQPSDIRDDESPKWKKILTSGASIHRRRLQASDFTSVKADAWYLCTGVGLRTEILQWLAGKVVQYEDFNY